MSAVYLKNSPVRSLLSLVFGLLLLVWPDVAVSYLVIFLGILFVIPGVISLLAYFLRNRSEEVLKPMFPFEGLGSILLGTWFIVMPEFFVNVVMYLFGFVLVVAGVQLISSVALAKRNISISYAYFILPILILLSGVFIIMYPFETVASSFWLFGLFVFIYGINELFNWYKFRNINIISD